MTDPKISIIVPVYNGAQFLKNFHSQLKNQTEPDFEAIFINDFSPDNSAEILDQIACEDTRVKVYHHTRNRYQGAARNTGLDHASGIYIAYIDVDDEIPTNYLEKLVSAMENNDADIVICNSVWVYPDHNEYHNMFLRGQTDYSVLLTGSEAIERYFNIFKDDIWIPVEPWGRIIKRALIEQNHLRNPETLFEDVVMSYAELLFSSKVLLLNDYLYYYNRKNFIAATINRQRQYITDFPFVFEGIKNVLTSHNRYNAELKWLSRFYFRYLCGTYEFFAKGGHFPEEMKKAIDHYKDLLPNPDLEGSEDYIYEQLIGFKYEMKRNNMSDLYFQFLQAHPEIINLINIQEKRRKSIINLSEYSRLKTLANIIIKKIRDEKL